MTKQIPLSQGLVALVDEVELRKQKTTELSKDIRMIEIYSDNIAVTKQSLPTVTNRDSAIPAILDHDCEPPNFGTWLVVEVRHPENVYLALNHVLLVEGIDGQWRAWIKLDGE